MGHGNYDEKRLFDRTPCSLSGKYVLADVSSGIFTCMNISPKGIGIQTAKSLPVDTKIRIEMNTKKDVPLILEGRVRWVDKTGKKYKIGIAFNEPLFILLSLLI